jgi:hypothetical protein
MRALFVSNNFRRIFFVMVACATILSYAARTTAAGPAKTITVIVDGETYNCSKGQAGNSNICDCIARRAGDHRDYYWVAYKRGNRVTSGGDTTFGTWKTELEAKEACKSSVITSPGCY